MRWLRLVFESGKQECLAGVRGWLRWGVSMESSDSIDSTESIRSTPSIHSTPPNVARAFLSARICAGRHSCLPRTPHAAPFTFDKA